MSKTVDSRVLEMRFDNKQFEAGVATSMSTLDKLKQKLNLSSSAKGLENVGAAAKKVNLNGLGSSVESVTAKFSALQVMGVTALANITNSAVNAGKRMVKALTLDPITTGFQEYETKINAVQTIMSNTASKGTTMADVTRVLDELNTYADKTIYNFAEMTRNIGTFTAAGVGLEDSAAAIQGIANLAAMSGSNSQQAATAMYQLSQALASGTVKLMDWNSVVNAGMGGQKFQDALKATAREHGVAVDSIIKKNGSFRDSLQEGWLSAEILNDTLKKMTVEGAKEYGEAMVKSGKYTQEQADALIKEAQAAEDAATKVKTFTQLWDTTKEAVQSGWAKTWELIIGDFEEAKNLLTPLSDFLNNIIEKFSDARNKLLESALGKGFGKLSDSLHKVLTPVEKVSEGIDKVGVVSDKVNKSLKDLGAISDDVINGVFGNGQERFDKLTKSGYNWYKVQNEVNKKLGDSKRYTEEQIAAQDKLLGNQEKTVKATAKTAEETGKLTQAQKDQLKSLAKMSEEQLRAKGYTEEQIEVLRELKRTAEKLGMPLDTFIDKLDEINGRFLLINSFKNIGTAIGQVLGAIGKGFRAVFEPIKPQQLFDAIAGLHKFTSQLVISDATADKLARTFKGLFAIVDLVTSIFGGGLKIAFTILSSLMDGLGLGVLDVTATVGDMVAKFNTWFQDNIFGKFIDKIVEKIPLVIDGIKEFIGSLNIGEGAANAFKTVCEGIGAAIDIIYGAVSRSLTTAVKLLGAVLSVFGTNLGEVASKVAEVIIKFRDWIAENTIFIDSINKIAEIIATVIKAIGDLAKKFMALKPVQEFIENLKETITGFFDKLDFKFDGGFLDGIANAIKNVKAQIEKWLSTLEDSEHFGRDLVAGLARGIISGVGQVISAIANLAQSIISTICGILGIHSPSTVMIAIGSFIILGLVKGIMDGWGSLGDTLKSIAQSIVNFFTDILEKGLPGLWDAVKIIGSKLKDALDSFDFDLGTLFVGGVIIAALLLIKKAINIADKLFDGVSRIGGVFDAVKNVLNNFADVVKAKKFTIYAEAIKSIAIGIGILAGSVYLLSKIKTGDLVKAGIALAAITGVLVGLLFAVNKFDKLGNFNFGKVSLMMIGLGAALILISKAIENISTIDPQKSAVAVIELIGLMVAMTLLIAAFGTFVKADVSGSMGKAGSMLLKMALALGVMSLVIKAISGLSWGEIGKGTAVIAGLMVLFGAIIFLFKFLDTGTPFANKAGTMMLRMALAIGILVGVIKLISGLSAGEITKGLIVIGLVMALFAAVMVASAFAGRYAARAGAMFLAMSLAIGVLVMCIKSIADIPAGDIAKGLIVIKSILKLFAGMMVLSLFVGKFAARAGAMFLLMSAAIGVLVICVKAIAGISLGDIVKGTLVIGGFMTMFALMMTLTKKYGVWAKEAGQMMLKMSAAILILVGAIAILAMLNPSDVIRGTLCISLLLGMFALLMYASKFVIGSQKTLTMIVVAIGMLAGAIIALSFLDQGKVITATACISALMGMFALIMRASNGITSSIPTIAMMVVAIGMISGCLYLLGQLPIGQSLAAAASLSMVLLALSAALVIVSGLKTISPMALLALTGMVVIMGLIGVVLGLMAHFDVTPSLETAAALSLLMIALSGSLVILAGVGAVAVPALIGVGVLLATITAIGTLMAAIGALVEYIPQLETFLDRGISVLGKIGEGIGQFIGGIAGGIMEGVSSGLPGFGANLGAFMTNAAPFFNGLSNIDPSIADSAKSLAVAILAITGSQILDSLTSWLTGGVDMAAFGEQLVGLGTAMRMYSMSVTGINTEAIVASAQAAQALVQVLNALPKEGGILQSIIGVEDIGSFGSKLVSFGTAMRMYSMSVTGINTAAIIASAEAAKALVEVSNALPKEGGLLQSIIGVEDIGSFGSKLVSFGTAMRLYSISVVGINTAAIIASAQAASALTQVANAIPKDGGIWQKLSGANDIGSFGSKLESFGKAMRKYAESVSGIDIGAISSSVSAARQLASLTKSMNGINLYGVNNFKKAVDKLADVDIKGVVKAFKNVSTASSLVSAGVKMIQSVGKGMKSQQSSLANTAKTIVNAAAKQITGASKSFQSGGTKLATALKTGFTKDLSKSLNQPIKLMLNSAIMTINAAKSAFERAGRALPQGLARGIRSGTSSAVAAARSMAAAVTAAARVNLKIHSPSKVFAEIGRRIPQGLAKGVTKYAYYAKDAIRSLTTETLAGAGKTINRLASLIDSDIDVQPTISPVLDLSNVESGVGAINGMFGMRPSISTMSHLGAINSMMNNRQNGSNDDIVDALKDLKKSINNMSGDTYSINGITYDDGTNVSEAVKTLVRAARVERRI